MLPHMTKGLCTYDFRLWTFKWGDYSGGPSLILWVLKSRELFLAVIIECFYRKYELQPLTIHKKGEQSKIDQILKHISWNHKISRVKLTEYIYDLAVGKYFLERTDKPLIIFSKMINLSSSISISAHQKT